MRYHEIINEGAGPEFIGGTYSEFKDLKAAIAKEWGSDEFERKMVKPTGSQRGFTMGVNHLINSEGEVVGMWETTSANMIPGRGVVVTGYGQVAKHTSKPAPAKNEPTAIPEPTAPATADEISDAVDLMLRQMKSNGGSSADIDNKTGKGFWIRYWGDWQVPYDAEDDGDYDWEELTDESGKKLDQLIRAVHVAFPNVKITVQGSEKNWLGIEATSRL